MLLKEHFHITSGDFLLGSGWRGEFWGGRPRRNLFIPKIFLSTPHQPRPLQICWVCRLRLSHIDKVKVHPGTWVRKQNTHSSHQNLFPDSGMLPGTQHASNKVYERKEKEGRKGGRKRGREEERKGKDKRGAEEGRKERKEGGGKEILK